MAQPSPSVGVCTICLESLRDARVLRCLHSFCKGCLDELDIRTGHERKIVCPVCRSTCDLPEDGASGLPRDITIALESKSECLTCSTENCGGEPEYICKMCDLTYCIQHALPHASATGHSVGPTTKSAASSSVSRPSTASACLCKDHKLSSRYFCQQCRVAVCGDCIVVGVHKLHKPIVAITDIAKDLKKRVGRKTDDLKNKRLPETQKALSAVEDVSSQLSENAESVRERIRASAKRAHDTVDLVMEQKLAQVDDLEELRLKNLNLQQDELKQHALGLKSTVGFSDKVVGSDEETKDVCELLETVEKRADELEKANVAAEPIEHSRVDFHTVSEEALIRIVNELVGMVLLCNACAEHSFVEGNTKVCTSQASPVRYTVVAKDYNNHRLSTGGDVVRVELRGASTDPKANPPHDVVDNNNGTYTLTITVQRDGDYSFDIFLNNTRLQQRLSISCHSTPLVFDPSECQERSTISGDKLTVTHTAGNRWSSVLGSRCMQAGQHVWKVNVRKSKDMHIFLGVAEKPGLTAKRNSLSSTYGWYGNSGDRSIMGDYSESMKKWRVNDVLQLHLDCVDRIVSIKNIRTGETDTIGDLPLAELFAFFATYSPDDSISLLP